ncbi:MAG: Flp pilus assembly protein CpaB [Chloroflexi bacterium]|nr:Flp pilus assembly protein CpaB [Chloroflexota bacterium]
MQRQSVLWIAVGIALAALAALFVYRAVSIPTFQKAQPRGQPVIVAASDVPRGTILQPDMVEVKEVPEDIIPQDAAVSIDDVVGKMPSVDLKRGEIILTSRLESPSHVVNDFGLIIPPGKVVVALPAEDLMNQVEVLKPGDHVNIMISFNSGAGRPAEWVTLNVLQNVVIQALVAPRGLPVEEDLASMDEAMDRATGTQTPFRAVLVAVDPQDALVLKYLKDVGGVIDFALRPQDDVSQPFLDPVQLEYLMDLYGLDIPLPMEGDVMTATMSSGGP